MSTTTQLFERRKNRTRHRLRQRARGRPRLSVFRSNKHIHAQVIDDERGHTLAAASSIDKALKPELGKGSDKTAAQRVGQLLGERARQAGVEKVFFDRGGYMYHGRVKALADGARDSGLDF